MDHGFAVYTTPLGALQIGYEEDHIVYIHKLKNYRAGSAPRQKKTPLTEKVYQQLEEYFKGQRKSFDFPYILKGTPFQKKVWKVLESIPYGQTRTYKEIAQKIGNEKAARAVGMANNKNPMTIVVPCHRVIGSNGTMVGYFGGVSMKKALLELEEKNQ